MKKLMLTSVALLCIGLMANAQGLKTPAPSTTQYIKQDFGLGNIELSYSRPSAKGRKIMGDLVPFGKVWRTGANNATTLTFSDDVSIGGQLVKAGKYGLLSIPGEKEWTFIITRDLNVTSPNAYKEANDVVRVKAPVSNRERKAETFTIQFDEISNNSIELYIRWENARAAFTITTDVDSKVMAQIENVMKADSRPYYAAAQYYYENNKDLKTAKEWADKAVAATPNFYWVTLLSARINNKLGDKAGAKAMAEKTLELATKANDEGYMKNANEILNSLKK